MIRLYRMIRYIEIRRDQMTEVDRIWDTVTELERKIDKLNKEIDKRLLSIEKSFNEQLKQLEDKKDQDNG